MNRASIPAFSYIRDTNDFIFITLGLEINGDLLVGLVYVPDENGKKIYPKTGVRYSRVYFDGHAHELKQIKSSVSPNQYRQLQGLRSINPIDGEEYLLLPKNKIVDSSDPMKGLASLMTNPRLKFVIPYFEEALKICKMFDIPEQQVGIYGGLQAGLESVETTNGRKLNDLDLVVYGVDQYSNLASLVQARGSYVTSESKYFEKKDFRALIYPKRWSLSCFLLQKGMGCDVRIGRLPNDRNSYLDAWENISKLVKETVNYEDAEVIDASESLSLPVAYTVKLKDARVLKVVSSYYSFIAVATVGDKVRVSGCMVGSNYLLITSSDPNEHYIIPDKVSVILK